MANPTTFGCSSNTAHSPKMMLGMAAARSTRAISERRLQTGAYSLRKMAVAMATGVPTTMATAATSMCPDQGRGHPVDRVRSQRLEPGRREEASSFLLQGREIPG